MGSIDRPNSIYTVGQHTSTTVQTRWGADEVSTPLPSFGPLLPLSPGPGPGGEAEDAIESNRSRSTGLGLFVLVGMRVWSGQRSVCYCAAVTDDERAEAGKSIDFD